MVKAAAVVVVALMQKKINKKITYAHYKYVASTTHKRDTCVCSKYVYYYGNQFFHSMDSDNRTREE